MLEDWRDGRIKQHVTARLLALRKDHADLFNDGDYEALECVGSAADNVIAFRRRHEDQQAIVVAGRLFVSLGRTADPWKDTAVRCTDLAGTWRNALDGSRAAWSADGTIAAASLLARLPVAVLVRANASNGPMTA